MSLKALTLAAVGLLASFSIAKAQIFTSGAVNPDGSNILNVGTVMYAANFDFLASTAVINGVTFTGTSQVNGSYQAGNFSITGAPGIDGLGGGTASDGSDSNASPAVQTLIGAGLPYNLTLTLNNLVAGQKYAVQLIIDANIHDARTQQYDDITNPGNIVASGVVTAGGNANHNGSDTNFGPQYITDTFTASGTSEVLQAQYSGGAGAQLAGFVLENIAEVPEPGPWAMAVLSLVGLALFGGSRRAKLRS